MQIMNNFSPKFRGTVTIRHNREHVCFNTNNMTYESKKNGEKTIVSTGNKEYEIPVSFKIFESASRCASSGDNYHTFISSKGEIYKFIA